MVEMIAWTEVHDLVVRGRNTGYDTGLLEALTFCLLTKYLMATKHCHMV